MTVSVTIIIVFGLILRQMMKIELIFILMNQMKTFYMYYNVLYYRTQVFVRYILI